MVEQNNQGKPADNPSESLYNKMASVQPSREVLLEEETSNVNDFTGQTASERSEYAPKLSDVQSAIKTLFPKLKGYLDILQVSRVFPETFNALLRLLVKDQLWENPEMGMAEAYTNAYTVLSIAIDGEGRIDIVKLSRWSSESEAEKNQVKVV